jgi:sugar phosphate permease
MLIFAGVSFRYGVYFFQFWMPMYLVKSRGFTEAGLLSTAWLFIAGATANLLGGTASDKLVKKVGLKASWGLAPGFRAKGITDPGWHDTVIRA